MKLRLLVNVERQWWNILLLTLSLLLSATAGGAEPAAQGFEKLAVLHQSELREISGLVASRQRPHRFWVLNDSGNPAELQALDASGAVRAVVPVANAINLDWEDLAAYEEGDERWLVIGDIGDNLSWRGHVSLYLLPEPAADAREARALREIRFQFEDGPRDCESLAVDLPNRRFLLLDKGRTPVGLYALPMDGPEELRTARRLADLPPLSPPQKPQLVEPLGVRWRGSPTAMDLSADGRRMLVLTYTHLLLFERREGEDWPQALQRPPRRARLPALDGFEAAALSPDGRQAWIINEGRSAVLYRWAGIALP